MVLSPTLLAIGGGTLFALLAFQVLVGKRIIRFKGPLHTKVHRVSAYVLLAGALVHAYLALTFLGIL